MLLTHQRLRQWRSPALENWSKLLATGMHRPFVLAGGITPDNVHDAIRATSLWAVDVASGIEVAPGVKDGEKMRRFVAEVRRADGTGPD